MSSFFDTPIEFLKGVGPQRAALLQKELSVFTYGDLLQHYPFRHEDRTKFYSISEANEAMPSIQLKGRITSFEMPGMARKKRLVGYFTDGTGEIELVWFQGINWVKEKIKPGIEYVVFGKPNRYGKKLSIAHPEIEAVTGRTDKGGSLQPVYSLTDKLRSKHMDSRFLLKLVEEILRMSEPYIRETLPAGMIEAERLIPKKAAVQQIHFPKDVSQLNAAQHRLKFEELFYIQLRLLKLKLVRQEKFKGIVFNDASLVTEFYNNHLPFALTDAQKRVIKEIYADMRSGKQMNRLLQGDVGSGKTIVAFICALLVISGGGQVALMAPTEILAQQHFTNLKRYASKMKIPIALLTGSTKQSERRPLHIALQEGVLKILIGTHALLEEEVKFNRLGLAIIDEQHRFGVEQRATLREKGLRPDVLLMTATPIPRTLALTDYSELEISKITDLPPGRKPVRTVVKPESRRDEVYDLIRQELDRGRQAYIIYPLVEESEKVDLRSATEMADHLQAEVFPSYRVALLHGRMKQDAKDHVMQAFIAGHVHMLVSTTVVEVGVDVPNASVMVVEHAERFGLSQLHQLRGRVGRGAWDSYCVLLYQAPWTDDARERLKTMASTTDGFVIAERDLELRGPGDVFGTRQSGLPKLRTGDLVRDRDIMESAHHEARRLVEEGGLTDELKLFVQQRWQDQFGLIEVG